ncbi:MAG: hypothetical protein Tsb0013_20890 [Phycisphaerales bacterium]
MDTTTQSGLSRRLTRRRCVACGCEHPSFAAPIERRPSWCPSCGEDLYARPPRSYAEMEGLAQFPVRHHPRRSMLVFFERSIAIALGLVVTLGLFASAMR